MSVRKIALVGLSTMLFLSAGQARLDAAPAGSPELHKAYYLEHQNDDYRAAKELYDRLVDADAPSDVRRAARAGSDRCRDHLAAEDFATLMPEDALAFIEIRRPGRIIEKLAEMLGLTVNDMRDVLDSRPNNGTNVTLDRDAPPLYIPPQIKISPAIFDALGAFGGLAIAVTDINLQSDGAPSGLMVLHHGDVTLLKGLLETFFQVAPVTEKIKDMPTFGFEHPEAGTICGVLTDSLLIVGTGRDLVEGAVNRLIGADTSSLASREDLQEVASHRAGATLFAFVNLQAAMKLAKQAAGANGDREFAIVDAFCDLDSLRWATFSMGIDDGTLGFQYAVRLADDHRSLAYNLTRLPPMSRNCLRHVPSDAAAIFGIGLNPAVTSAAVDAAAGTEMSVTGFDIGREFFGNIQEICAFIIPGRMKASESKNGPPVIPNVGVLLAVNDTAKSKALWNQFLSIPGLIAGDKPIAPTKLKIGGNKVTAYPIPDFGKVYMAELDGCIALGATRGALKAVLKAHTKNASILDDETMGGIIAEMPKDCSIMAVAHVGRLAQVAAGSGDPGASLVATQAAQLCPDMVAWFGLGQSPNQLTVQAAIRGLPNLNKALEMYAPMLAGAMSAMGPPEDKVGPLTQKVVKALGQDDYETALKYAHLAHDEADIGLTNFNLACVYSRMENNDKAFEYLFRAVELGMGGQNMVKLIEGDSDLDNLRDDPRYEEVLNAAKDKRAEPAKIKTTTRTKKVAALVEL